MLKSYSKFIIPIVALFLFSIQPVGAAAPDYGYPGYTVTRPGNIDYTRPSYDVSRPSYDFTRPSYDYTRPSYEYTRPSYDYTRPSYDYTRPSYDYTRPSPTPTPQPVPRPDPNPNPNPGPNPDNSSLEQRLVNLINQERVIRGLNPLKVHSGLTKLARMKSQDMITHNYFAHTSPTYGTVSNMIRNAGIQFQGAGENLASGLDLPGVHNRLMASDGHKQNILYPYYTHVGVGMVTGGKWGGITTQLFMIAP